MVRTSVKNIVLNIMKSKSIMKFLYLMVLLDQHDDVTHFFHRFPFNLYYVNLACYISDMMKQLATEMTNFM